MPSHKEHKILPYSAKQMLDLVMDIENYPQFLPWCLAAKIKNHVNENILIADLVISFKAFSEKYTSEVITHKISDNEYRVAVVAIEGPFKNLVNDWHFKDISHNNQPAVSIEFFIDFKFRSLILDKMIGVVFEKATNKMINAFEKRAAELYKTNSK
ncbi:MAG: type II toxin-antitoxin system RatA family toxin [Proteobacteria bacterium]|nr:type II toxin-antitoxin system RatA family toxin [Pseudomonadota bacterium]